MLQPLSPYSTLGEAITEVRSLCPATRQLAAHSPQLRKSPHSNEDPAQSKVNTILKLEKINKSKLLFINLKRPLIKLLFKCNPGLHLLEMMASCTSFQLSLRLTGAQLGARWEPSPGRGPVQEQIVYGQLCSLCNRAGFSQIHLDSPSHAEYSLMFSEIFANILRTVIIKYQNMAYS